MRNRLISTSNKIPYQLKGVIVNGIAKTATRSKIGKFAFEVVQSYVTSYLITNS